MAYRGPLHEYLFIFGDDDEEQLLLVLALLSDERPESLNPAITADQIVERIETGEVPRHPSLRVETTTSAKLVRALRRLSKEGLVRSGQDDDGVLVWSLRPEGYSRLSERMVFDLRADRASPRGPGKYDPE